MARPPRATRENASADPESSSASAAPAPEGSNEEGVESDESGPRDPLSGLFGSLSGGDDTPDARKLRQELATESLDGVLTRHSVRSKYNVLILFDEGQLIRSDADRIYSAIRKLDTKRDILLVIYSGGGQIEPAYLISQLCRESAKQKFVAVVPRRAKSAATLICCGADEIHMGAMSELGPVDPQIGEYPALGLGNAMQYIAELVSRHPGASKLFADYLAATVPPIDLGYYERVVESAAQYAEKLLTQHSDSLSQPPNRIANTLVHAYKDHGFVIDRNEATAIFGDRTIRIDTPEYKLGNAIYNHLSFLQTVCAFYNFKFYWVGSLASGCTFFPSRE